MKNIALIVFIVSGITMLCMAIVEDSTNEPGALSKNLPTIGGIMLANKLYPPKKLK